MISLKPYVGKTVMLQLKPPHACKMSVVHQGQLMPLALVFEEGKPPRLATEKDPQEIVRPMATDLLIGEVKEIDGRFVLSLPEPASQGEMKLEVELSGDLVLAVTVAPPRSLVALIG